VRIFDPHIHMTSRTTDDYVRMHAAGVRAVVEPSFWLGQPRTSVGSFTDYFDSILGWEPFRASQYGIAHHATIGLNPKEANDPRCREVLEVLPRYLVKDRVVAVGELGYDSMTPEEDEVFAAQLALAAEHELPALVHTPHRDKLTGTRRTLDVVRESAVEPGAVIVDHLNEMTVDVVAESGCWMGFSVYPDTKMDEHRMVEILRRFGLDRMIVNSAADWGNSDPLKTVRVAEAMLAGGFSDDDVDRVLWRNPVEFYSQSGRLELPETQGPGESAASAASDEAGAPSEPVEPGQAAPSGRLVGAGTGTAATFMGNSVLRGARD
jgi:predicted metal-dependent TIM-barrel fold hydrolase